jgi:flagellar biosynthesis anti-sigma factor FlgM
MKIADKGPADLNISRLTRGDAASAVRDKGGKKGVERAGDAAQVSISAEARKLQRVVELGARGDELRAEKVRQLKEQIAQGTYHVAAADVAKGIARGEISRLLGKD